MLNYEIVLQSIALVPEGCVEGASRVNKFCNTLFDIQLGASSPISDTDATLGGPGVVFPKIDGEHR